MNERSSQDTQHPPHVHRHSTSVVSPADQFDYWRSLFKIAHLDRPAVRPRRPHGFAGEFISTIDRSGVAFVNLRAAPLISQFGLSDSGVVLLGHLRAGRVDVSHERGDQTVLTPESGLVLFDCDQRAVSNSHDHDMTYLALPRRLVAAAIGADPAPGKLGISQLNHSPLIPVLLAQFRAMAEHLNHLDAFERAAAIQSACTLAFAILGTSTRPGIRPEILDNAMLAAARHQLHMQLSNPELTAGRIAASVGCSRAHLFHLFAQQGQTVFGYLRELRLNQAHTLITTHPNEAIGMIAFRCGYTDVSAFGKAFKRRFGLSPQDCRASTQPSLSASQPVAH